MLSSFSQNKFCENVESTTGALFFTHALTCDGQTYSIDIWDTAGQEKFRALGALYYKSAKGALVVFDVTAGPSFERAKQWIRELEENADPDIVIALVGNKADVVEGRAVSRGVAESYCGLQGLLYYEVSAKTGQGVREMFLDLMAKMPLGGRNLATSAIDAAALAEGGRQPSPRQPCC